MDKMINQEKFSAALNLLEDYKNNKLFYELEEAKLKLEATFRAFEFAYLGLDNINDELIFKEIEEYIATLQAVNLSFGEYKIDKGKGKMVESEEENYDWLHSLTKEELINIVKSQVETIEEHKKENQQLINQLTFLQEARTQQADPLLKRHSGYF